MAAAQTVPQPTPQAQLALAKQYGPNSARAFQRSQYLADALQQMQTSGNDNLRTPANLGLHLLAQGLTAWAKTRADKEAMGAYQQDLDADNRRTLAGTPYDPAIADRASATGFGADMDAVAKAGGVDGAGTPAAAPGANSSPNGAPPSLPSGGLQVSSGVDTNPTTTAPPPNGTGSGPSAAQLAAALIAPDSAAPPTAGTGQRGAKLAAALASGGAPGPPDQQRLHLAQMVWGEGRGEPPEAQRAIAAVALNRARESGRPLDEVLAAPHQFSGYSARARSLTPDQLQPVLNNIMPLVNGQAPDPSGGADHFYAPALASPSWGQGPGTMVGHQKFLALGYGGGQPGQGGAVAPSPATSGAQGDPSSGMAYAGALRPDQDGAQLIQVSNGNGTPPPIAGASGGQAQPLQAPPAAPASETPQGGTGAPGSPPHQYVSPDEYRALVPYLNDPRTHDWARQQIIELKLREASPVETPKDMAWNPQTRRYEAVPGTTDVQLRGASPSDSAQVDRFGHVTHQKIDGVQGEVPPGTRYDAQTRSYVSISGGQARPLTDPAERQRLGIQPSDRNAYMVKPNGEIVNGAPDPFGPKDQLAYTAQVVGLEPYKNYVLGRGYLSTIQQLMKQPGGFADLGIIENGGKTVNPTIAIRPNMIEQYGKEVGWPDWLVGEVSSVMNHGGHLTQQGRNAILNIAQANVQSHWEQLQPILKKVDHDASRYGISREDLLPDLVPMPAQPPPSYPGARIPGAPQPGSPGGQGPGGLTQEQVTAEARAAIAQGKPRGAVMQRVQQMGFNPAGL
jgi:hypothetical protein